MRSRSPFIPVGLLLILALVAPAGSGGRSAAAAPEERGGGCRGVTVQPGDNVQSMLDRHATGATFCFQKGVYRIREPLVPRRGQKLIAVGRAVINGSVRVTSWTRSGDHWIARDQRMQGPVGDAECEPAGYTGCRYPEGLYFDDKAFRQVTSLSALRPGTFYFDYGANVIHIDKNPAGHKVEVSVSPGGFHGFVGGNDDVTIRGFVIEKFATHPTDYTAAIKPGGDWRIMYNEIRFSHTNGIQATGGTWVYRNRIHHNGLAGIRGEADHVTIERNVIAYNNIERFSRAYSGGVRMVKSRDVELIGNRVFGNFSVGLKMDTDNIDILYARNEITGNMGPGIDHEVSYDAVIRGNFLKNNGRANKGGGIFGGTNILIHSSPHVTVVDNTVISTIAVNGIVIRDSERGSGPFGAYEIRDVIVSDNVVKMVPGARTGAIGSREFLSSSGSRFVRNRYLVKRRGLEQWFWSTSKSWLEWQASGQDSAGQLSIW
jgi:hypothetical protein